MNKRAAPLPVNVDGAIAAICADLGFAYELGNAIFLISRLPGLIAHAHEERTRNAPMRQIDPKDHDYDGSASGGCPRGASYKDGRHRSEFQAATGRRRFAKMPPVVRPLHRQRVVHAQRSSTIGCQKRKDRRVEQRQLALILYRPRPLRCVRDEIRGQHFNDQQRGDRPGEQPDNQKQPAGELENSGNAELRQQIDGSPLHTAEQSEQLLESVLEK